jgi:hypothetical protein
MKKLNLSLKNLKFHEDMSEETPCFSADLYQDGKLIAHVRNDGHGGCNRVDAAKGLLNSDVAHLWDMDVDCDIMQMAEDLNFIRKNQGKKFLLRKDGNEYTQKSPKSFAQLKKAPNYKEWLQKKLDAFKRDGYEVLNTNL